MRKRIATALFYAAYFCDDLSKWLKRKAMRIAMASPTHSMDAYEANKE